MTTDTVTFAKAQAEIEELAVQEASGATPTGADYGRAFSRWLFGEEPSRGTLIVDLDIVHSHSRTAALILAVVRRSPGVTKAEIQDALSLGESVVYRTIRRLIASDLVRMQWHDRSTPQRFYALAL